MVLLGYLYMAGGQPFPAEIVALQAWKWPFWPCLRGCLEDYR